VQKHRLNIQARCACWSVQGRGGAADSVEPWAFVMLPQMFEADCMKVQGVWV